MVFTSFEARAKLAVPINGFLHSITDVPSAIRRFCTPAFFHHDNSDFDLSALGTAFLFRYRGRNFGVCTAHQLDKSVNQEDFTVLVDGGKKGISPNRISKVRMDNAHHANLEDLFIAEYDNIRDGRDVRGMFLSIDLGVNLQSVPQDQVLVAFAIGYPTFAREADMVFDDDGIMTSWSPLSKWVKLYLKVDKPALLDTENRIPMIQDDRADQQTIEPDGMSGSPVFFIGKTPDNDAYFGFAGMITTARDRRYMVYDGAILKSVIDRCIDDGIHW